MSFLTSDQILAAKDLPFEDVVVEEWGGMVRVAGLSAKDASEFSAQLVQMDGNGHVKELKMGNFLAELLMRTLVNESFEPLFSKTDIEALGKKSAAVMKRLADIAMQQSGLSETSIPDAVKN